MKHLRVGMRILLGVLFVVAGINHFVHPNFYINIMPDYLPAHRALVLLRGVTEIVAGAMLFLRRTSALGAWGIVAMLVLFFMVHIHMIAHADRYASVPLVLLYVRVALQFPLILWAWWFTRPEPLPQKGASDE